MASNNESQLLDRLRNQLEFYFSAKNLSRDVYLRNLLNQHGGTAVPLWNIANFPKVRELIQTGGSQNEPVAMLMRAMEGSTVASITADGAWIVSLLPIPALNPNAVGTNLRQPQIITGAPPQQTQGLTGSPAPIAGGEVVSGQVTARTSSPSSQSVTSSGSNPSITTSTTTVKAPAGSTSGPNSIVTPSAIVPPAHIGQQYYHPGQQHPMPMSQIPPQPQGIAMPHSATQHQYPYSYPYQRQPSTTGNVAYHPGPHGPQPVPIQIAPQQLYQHGYYMPSTYYGGNAGAPPHYGPNGMSATYDNTQIRGANQRSNNMDSGNKQAGRKNKGKKGIGQQQMNSNQMNGDVSTRNNENQQASKTQGERQENGSGTWSSSSMKRTDSVGKNMNKEHNSSSSLSSTLKGNMSQNSSGNDLLSGGNRGGTKNKKKKSKRRDSPSEEKDTKQKNSIKTFDASSFPALSPSKKINSTIDGKKSTDTLPIPVQTANFSGYADALLQKKKTYTLAATAPVSEVATDDDGGEALTPHCNEEQDGGSSTQEQEQGMCQDQNVKQAMEQLSVIAQDKAIDTDDLNTTEPIISNTLDDKASKAEPNALEPVCQDVEAEPIVDTTRPSSIEKVSPNSIVHDDSTTVTEESNETKQAETATQETTLFIDKHTPNIPATAPAIPKNQDANPSQSHIPVTTTSTWGTKRSFLDVVKQP